MEYRKNPICIESVDTLSTNDAETVKYLYARKKEGREKGIL